MEKIEVLFAVTVLGCLLLGGQVSSFYVKKSMQPSSSRDLEADSYVPRELLGSDWADDSQYLGDIFKRASFEDDSQVLFPAPQKRYFCRKHFVYNPVKGRCQPTMLAIRKG